MKTKKITALFISIICAISCVMPCAELKASAAPQGEATIYRSKQRLHTRPEIIFSPEGSSKKFILLDESDEGFFILSYDMYGAHKFDPDNTEKFDIKDTNNVAYWLNNDFLKEGNYYSRRSYIMPDAIIRNAIEHDWLTEAGGPHTDFQEDYITRCAFALLSKTEVMKYFDKFGLRDDTSITSMMLRTSAGTVAQTGGVMLCYILKHVAKEGMIRTAKSSKNGGIRPAFYLDKDFFIKERIDITTAGDDIRKLIKSRYSKDELKKIYSSAEISKLTGELPPQALNVRVTGQPVVGETLKCTYDYYAPDGQSESGTKIQWLRYEQGSEIGSVIFGAVGMEYIPTSADVGKGISVRVTPACANKTGRVTEAEFYRGDILEIVDISKICIDELEIQGNKVCGGTVYAQYKYYHPTYFIEKGTTYEWQASDSLSDFKAVSTLGTERQASIPDDFEYKYIRCIVRLNNSKEYISDACEVTKAQKSQKKSFTCFPLRDSETIPCVKGQSYRIGTVAFNIAEAVSFTADKDTRVTAEGCSVYSAEAGERTYFAVTKNPEAEKMEIVIHADYDGTLSIRDISVAIKE